MLGFCDSLLKLNSLSALLCDFRVLISSFAFEAIMTSMERPETNAVVVDEPAAAGTALPAVGIDVVPTPKAAGPAGPPAGGEPNLRGGTVFGVLLQDRDLLTVPLDELMALSMASVEASDQLLSETPFEIAKAEAEKWHRSAGQALDAMHGVQSDLDKIQRIHAEEPTRNLAEIPLLPEGNGTNSGVTYQELQIRRQAYQLRQQHLRAGATFGRTFISKSCQLQVVTWLLWSLCLPAPERQLCSLSTISKTC